MRFEYIETLDSTVRNAWSSNRQEVYEGSVRHLLRSVVDRTLMIENFALYKDETNEKRILRHSDFEANVGKGITYHSQVQMDEVSPNNYKVYLPARLEVHYLDRVAYPKIYRDVNNPVSWLEVGGGHLYVNGKGIVLNPSKLILSGQMSEARIAELLPYDFDPERRDPLKTKPPELKKDDANPLSFLIEKPYLHTDKSSYYPNEMLWFRGYMNYAESLFKDSLSKILYVDLIDHDKNMISRKILPIDDGVTVGNLMIPSATKPGDYTLRAYTRWLFNFNESLVFLQPIRILSHEQVGKVRSDYVFNDSTSMVTMTLNKEVFHPREKITVKLGVKDDLELFQHGNFSVSVTDINQVAPAKNEGSILTDFQIGNVNISSEIFSSGKYPVQRGIEFRGQLFTKKGKPTQGTLILEQENSGGQITITTADNGMFSFKELNVYDSSSLFVLPETNKGLIGKLVIDSLLVTPFSHTVEPLKIDVVESENPSQFNAWQAFSNARMLREVVIQGTRLQDERPRGSISNPDYFITGESLRASHTTDIISAIQSKVPGVRVIGGTIVLGAIGTFGNPEALILIDGLAINGNVGTGASSDDLSSSVLEKISSLTPQEIERIEILKFSGATAYGSRGANGVISITTRQSGDERSHTLRRGKFQVIKFPRLSLTSEFYAPDNAGSGGNPSADYRSTIYWNPYVETGQDNVAEISFYAAELHTQYRIVVEGILRDGSVVHAEKLITIEPNP